MSILCWKAVFLRNKFLSILMRKTNSLSKTSLQIILNLQIMRDSILILRMKSIIQEDGISLILKQKNQIIKNLIRIYFLLDMAHI